MEKDGEMKSPPKKIKPVPWMVPGAIVFLKEIIGKIQVPSGRMPDVIETGSGGSTLFFQEHCNLISFEHNRRWFNAVDTYLERDSYDRTYIDLRFDPEYPKKGLRNLRCMKFDIALIDGRGRVKSIMDIIPHMADGGWIILDNAERPRYRPAVKHLNSICDTKASFTKHWTTTFWKVKYKR